MKEDDLDNNLLVLGCQKRDQLAFRKLVNRWEPRLYYYLRRILENESTVWDALQETWLAVFRDIRTLEDVRKFPIWLYRVSHSKAVDLLRKENRYVQVIEEPMTDYSEDNSAIAITKEQAELVHKQLDKLKTAHREVLTLYFLEGFSIKEMAVIIGVSQGTVKSRLHYAKKKLSEMLREVKNENTRQ